MCPRERVRECRGRIELAVAQRAARLRDAGQHRPGSEQATFAPTREDQRRRDEADHDRRERRPDMSSDRRPVVEDDSRPDDRHHGERREHQHDGDVGQTSLRALPPQRGNERRGHNEVCGCQDEKRNRIEDDRLRAFSHWAWQMIGRPRFPRLNAFSVGKRGLLRLAKMGRPAHCDRGGRSLASLPLGDANRGGRAWPCWSR